VVFTTRVSGDSTGARWRILGGFWGLLFGSAAFAILERADIVAGPLVADIGLEGAAVVGGVSAVGRGCCIGIPERQRTQIRHSLKTDKYVLVMAARRK